MRSEAITEALTCMWRDTDLHYEHDSGNTYPVEVTIDEEGLTAQKRVNNENSVRVFELRMSPAVLEGFRQAVRDSMNAKDDERVNQRLRSMLVESYDRYWQGNLRRGLLMGLSAGAVLLLIIMFTNGPLSEAPSWMTVGGVVLGVVAWLLIYGRRMRIRQLWDEEAPTDAEGVLRALEKTSEWMR